MANMKVTLKDVSIGQVTIPAQIVDAARRYLIENNVTKEGLSSYIEKQLLPIQIQAKQFLEGLLNEVEAIQNLMQQRVELEKATLRVKQGKSGSAIIFSYNQKKFKTLGNLLYNATIMIQLLSEGFSASLQQILTGNRPQIAFTPLLKNGSPSTEIFLLDSIQSILKIQRRSRNIYEARLRSSLNNIKKITAPIDKSKYLQENQAILLEKTYAEVLNRFSNPKHKYKHSPPTLILWDMAGLSKKDWRGMWLGNQRGDIVQAYQRAVFSRINSFIPTFTPPEINIQIFMQLLTLVDSTSGTLTSDIQLATGSYASKLQGAEPAGIKDAIKYASSILDIKTQQEIFRYLQSEKILSEKAGSSRGNIIFDISNDALKDLQKQMKP